MPRTTLPTLGKCFLDTGGSLQALIGGVPAQAGFGFLREMVLQKWSGCLAGHWGELVQAKFGNEGELMKTT